MLSFASSIKDEIVAKEFPICCQKAILAAFLKLNGIIDSNFSNIKIQNFHSKTIKLIYQLLKINYQGIDLNLVIEKYSKTQKLTIVINNYINEIINDYSLLSEELIFIKNKQLKTHCLRAYIASVFLLSGSINSPNTANYHLEFQLNDLNHALQLQKFLKVNFKLEFKVIKRRAKNVLYLKKSNDIVEFLKVLDCPQAVFNFEDKRITRELLNTINRFNNIDISNQQKVINAGSEQVKMILFLKKEKRFDELSHKAQLLANLRIKHQDVSLTELKDIYFEDTNELITKSGVNHLIREIKHKYQQLINSELESK